MPHGGKRDGAGRTRNRFRLNNELARRVREAAPGEEERFVEQAVEEKLARNHGSTKPEV